MGKYNKVFFLLAIAATMLFNASCTDSYDADISIANPADSTNCDSAICTYEYRTIIIHLTNKNNPERALQLESRRVFFTESGKDITDQLANKMLFSDASRYEIASDGIIDQIAFAGTSITFEAKINKFKIWKREFIIAKDCCHIYSPDEQQLEFEL
ncbi:MAG: hypothetical protein ACPGLV_01700 [Bacteroidia bacterium]